MILVDTSVWIDHLRQGDQQLVALLEDEHVCCHPFVIGELACGNLRNRDEILGLLRELPQVEPADDGDVHHLVDARSLWARGLGWVDMHLLTATLLAGCTLWTRDKALATAANDLAIAAF